MRIALDTNVLVSAFATRGLSADLLATVLADHHLILGETVPRELDRVLRTKIGLPDSIAAEAVAFLRGQALVVDSAPPLVLRIRDEDDRAVLAEAVEGGAEVLVTGDGDLLAVAGDPPLRIVAPRGLWEELRKGRGEGERPG